jgi:hypothetical protein
MVGPAPRGNDHRLMAAALKMFQYPEDGVGNSVDLRQKTLGDNRHAHRQSR